MNRLQIGISNLEIGNLAGGEQDLRRSEAGSAGSMGLGVRSEPMT
jgi:hypothetical protein